MNTQNKRPEAANSGPQQPVGNTPPIDDETRDIIPQKTARACASTIQPEKIPEGLRARPQWVCWKLEEREGKPTKIPYSPKTGSKAKADDPNTWGTFEQACKRLAVKARGYSGIGYVFSKDDPYVGIDLDHCVTEDGDIQDWAQRVVNRLDSYTEYSPSGTGVHIIGIGSKPGPRCKKVGFGGAPGKDLEMYDHDRYFCMTGNVVRNPIIEKCGNEINGLYYDAFGDPDASPQPAKTSGSKTPANLSDAELIAAARAAQNGTKFSALWDGDTSLYGGDDSSADQALCNLLAFWTGCDAARMDRLFRQSGLYREKWERQDYRERTINKAIESCPEGYKGSPNASKSALTDVRPEPTPEEIDLARASVAAAKEAGTAAAVMAIVEQLAIIPEGEYQDIVGDLKKAIPALDLRTLKGKVTRLRKQRLRRRDIGDYPVIVVNNRQLRDMGDQALQIIKKANLPPVVFVRSGDLVRLSIDENHAARIQNMTESHVIAHLAKLCDCVVVSEDSVRNTTPPRCIAEYILAQPSHEFPALAAITNSPPVRPDGSISTAPGYDPETGLYYHQKTPCDVGSIAEKPTAEDVRTARELLEEIICDFPFADDGASKANAIALMMTPVLRTAFQGLPQGALIDAPKQKSGKGLLSQITAIIATGGESAVTPAPISEEEWGKVITAKLIDGPTLLIFDNIKHTLGGASLEAALTATEWENRLLGLSKNIRLPNLATWIFNGNNVKTTDDIVTRVFSIRIDPKCSDPEMRTGFKHPDLKKWVAVNRGRIINAIVTLFRHWLAEGRPAHPEVPIVGAYEDWAFTIGNILQHAGIEGFLSNRKELKQKLSTEAPQWEAFLSEWIDVFGKDRSITVKEFVERLEADGAETPFGATLPADLAKAMDARTPQGKRVNVGRVFSNREDSRFGDRNLYLYNAGTYARAVKWAVSEEHPIPDTPSGNESVSLNESVEPKRGKNDSLYWVEIDTDNKSRDIEGGDTVSNRLTDSLQTQQPECAPYECGSCHQDIELQPAKERGLYGRYSCPHCGHEGQVTRTDYDIWQRRRAQR